MNYFPSKTNVKAIHNNSFYFLLIYTILMLILIKLINFFLSKYQISNEEFLMHFR